MPGRVLITRPIPEPGPERIARAADELVANPNDRPLPTSDLLRQVAGFDAVVCLLNDRIDGPVMDRAAGCKLFANMAVGYNNIDVAEATRRGILVTNTPGVLTEATADITWTLILGVARKVAEGDRVMRAGTFPGWGPLYMIGTEVSGKTLGLVGPGRIAQAVAERARGFRMPLLYQGRRDSPEMEALGARRVDLETLLREGDFVSLHVPLTAETKHMIDRKALALMKPSAFLINTSRGPVVDEAALVEVLKAGRIAGAGLDVYEREPEMAPGLADCPNTLLLPHLGTATTETRARMSALVADNVIAVLEGKRPPNLVNPEAWRDSAAAPSSP